jgi:4-amino-4-deoxy-L-arabinose transferase-like glycosyltransferase
MTLTPTPLGAAESLPTEILPQVPETSPEPATGGGASRPRWEVPAFVAMIAGTAALYLWNLAASGYANAFYSAAAQAGSQSWWAFLWGASDAGSITVDKPPASLWVMGLSVRVFGLSSWSILVPQALMGVVTVALVYRIVRRRYTAGAALLAGTVLALTPVAALMFRFNNPDALLVLLLTASVWATMRAIEGPRTTRWMVLAGVLVGFAFLTKQLQALLVLPGLAAAFLWAAPVTPWRRVRDGLLAVGALVASAGWWVALVELWPADSRPYIGGSQTNSFLELTFGYNGLGRITGNETGSVGGGGAQGSMWGATGLTRLFGSEMGGQIAWLLPAALVLGVVAFVLRTRAARTDARRAQVLIWVSWLVVTGLVFSLMAGIFHAYYTVALAPAIAALVGIGASELWARRDTLWSAATMAAVTLGTAAWSFVLLNRSADFVPWLRWTVFAAGAASALVLLAGPSARRSTPAPAAPRRSVRRRVAIAAAIAVLTGLAGPAAYALDTAATAHTGSLPTAGPTVSGGMGGPGRRGGMVPPGNGRLNGAPGGQVGPGTQGGTQGVPNGVPPIRGGAQAGQSFGRPPGGAGGGMGGLLNGTEVPAQVEALLTEGSGSYTWVAAVVGAQNAASYQLSTEESVMPIGGFNGTDPSPTLAQFQAWAAEGKIHYFIATGGTGGRSATGSEIATWVESTFTAQTVDGVTLYDLTSTSTAG